MQPYMLVEGLQEDEINTSFTIVNIFYLLNYYVKKFKITI